MTDKIPPVAKFAVLLAAVVAVTGCSSAKQQNAAAPTTTQATKPATRSPAPAKPRIVHPHNRAVPILMYHVVGTAPADAPNPGLYVRRADFAGQLTWLRAHGYHAVSLRRVYDYWKHGYALPQKPVVLTFDDGYREDFTNVRPLLARRHWPGVLNLAVRNLLDGKLTVPQIRLMIRQGWEIDAHTINHLDLTTLSSSDVRHEVAGSRTWIRRRFHVPVAFFCYPSGRYDARVVAAVRAAGFFGATIEGFGPASPRDGLLTLPRIRVDGSDGVSGLAAKLAAYG
jgi:peptidoglycan/xylan/chitin deacetylase (PgdA/CDA1 family)